MSAQEFQWVFAAKNRSDPPGAVSYDFVKEDRRVGTYYFYVLDRDFGPGFIKICTYFPYPAKVWLNGHEWAKRQAARKGVRFEELGNGFAACDRPGRLQAICNHAGAHVVTFDLGDVYDENPLDDEVQEELVACRSYAEGFQLSSYGPKGRTWRDVLEDDGPDSLVSEASRRGGAVEAVYLGSWWGFVDYDVLPALVEVLETERGGEPVVTEGAGQRVARSALAMAADAKRVKLDVVRETSGDGAAPHGSGAGRAAAVLIRSGWSRLTAEKLDEEAADLRARGLDRLAGTSSSGVGGGGGFDAAVAPAEVQEPGDPGAMLGREFPRVGLGLTTAQARQPLLVSTGRTPACADAGARRAQPGVRSVEFLASCVPSTKPGIAV